MNRTKYAILLLLGLFLTACSGDIDNNRAYFPQSYSDSSTNVSKEYISDDNCDQIITKEFSLSGTLSICYDYTYKSAKYVSYTLDGELVNSLNISTRPSFYIEPQIPSEYQVSTNDYTYSGYDRGHLAPDASFDYSEGDLKIIYTMANIIPQDSKVNGTLWAKAEQYARDMAVEYGEVSVLNGVVFDSNPTYIKGEIAISIGFWKQISNDAKGFKRCFYYDNFITTNNSSDTLDSHEIDCSTLK